jgi:hypothetical protein
MVGIDRERPDWLAYEARSHALRSVEIARLFAEVGAWLRRSLRYAASPASTPISLDTRIGTSAR